MARKRGSHAKVSIADAKGREQLVLWRSPRMTLYYFLLEVILHLKNYGNSLWHNKKKACLFVVLLFFSVLPYYIQGPHQQYLDYLSGKLWWCFYWVGLGVLSSVGLGTGLHTFLLYLGPHIAAVTMAAYECQSLKFPQPPYPDDIICPETAEPNTVSMWSIMSKVRLEAFMWGAGTAMGELPPYFMARAARLSGAQDDEELEEFEKLLKKKKKHESMSWLERAKLSVEKIVERVGFLGILACASIPNPLFDLAGITCGHFLVPFWTFFGATLLGKAVIKMHIQKVFVILAFNENLLEGAVSLLLYIPYIGKSLQAPFYDFLVKQKAKLHRTKEKPVQTESSLLQSLFEVVIMIMVAYFLLSIVNSFAQTYHKRLQKQSKKKRARD